MVCINASVFLAHRPPFKRAGRTLLYAVATFAVCIVGFGLSRSFGLSLALLAISGVADNVSVLIRSTLLQVLTPSEMFGRVTSVNSIFVGSSNELGAFESGVAAKFRDRAIGCFGRAGLTQVVVTIGLWVPRLRQQVDRRLTRQDPRHSSQVPEV